MKLICKIIKHFSWNLTLPSWDQFTNVTSGGTIFIRDVFIRTKEFVEDFSTTWIISNGIRFNFWDISCVESSPFKERICILQVSETKKVGVTHIFFKTSLQKNDAIPNQAKLLLTETLILPRPCQQGPDE